MDRLIEGHMRFRHEVFPSQREHFAQLARQQQPQAMFITCADSRIVPEMITQTRPGDLFVCRNAGNIVPPYAQINEGVSAAIEYGVLALQVRDIIVCGHFDCGAIKGILHSTATAGMPTVSSWLRHADVARHVVEEICDTASEQEYSDALTCENVIAQLAHLRTHPSVAAKLASRQLRIHGWIYRIETGSILIYEPAERSFAPLEHHSVARAQSFPALRRVAGMPAGDGVA
jgi:carbonic anhydrase